MPDQPNSPHNGREKFLERLDLAYGATKPAIWDWDIENKQYWSSSGNQLLFGADEAEVTITFDFEDADDPWMAGIHSADRAQVIANLRDHLDHNSPFDVEFRYRLSDGGYISVRSIGRAVESRGGKPVRTVGSNSDITAEKLAQTESERFREAVDNASEGVVLYDADERFVYANKRYRGLVPAIAHLLKPGVHREKARQVMLTSGTLSEDAETADQFMDEMRRHQSVGGTGEL